MEYLRYIVRCDGVESDPEKVQAVTEWPQPLHQRDVCLFLGTAGYYRGFIPQYSEVAKPLTQLTGNVAPSKISGDCDQAFSLLCAVHLNLHIDFCSGYRCQHFDCYLLGKELVVRNASHSGKVARWREMLSEYQVKLEYWRGLKHSNADGLTRQLCQDCPQCNNIFGEQMTSDGVVL